MINPSWIKEVLENVVEINVYIILEWGKVLKQDIKTLKIDNLST